MLSSSLLLPKPAAPVVFVNGEFLPDSLEHRFARTWQSRWSVL